MADVADGLARLPKMAADDAVRFLADQLGYGKYLDKNGMDRTLSLIHIFCARTRPPFIGGSRAVYSQEEVR